MSIIYRDVDYGPSPLARFARGLRLGETEGMRVYHLPKHIAAFLFDIDSTLYTNPDYAAFQNDVLIRELAAERDWSWEAAVFEVERARTAWCERNGVERTSLGNAFLELGIPIETSVEWRKRAIKPGSWLEPDAELERALARLTKRAALAAVTNNPRSVGVASLEALGVSGLFKAVVGLDDTMVSKPAREPFELAIRKLGVPASTCVAVGDRYDVDLAVPIELGCGAVLVDGVGDVYRLSDLLET